MRLRPAMLVAAVLVLAGAVLAAGCYPKAGPAPAPLSAAAATSASTRWPGATPASLAAGHDLFIAHCNACHSYPDLESVSEESWPSTLDSMAKKAKLTPAERDEVLHYVLAARAEAPAP